MIATWIKHCIYEKAIEVFFDSIVTNFTISDDMCLGKDLTKKMHGLVVTVKGRNLNVPLTGRLWFPLIDKGILRGPQLHSLYSRESYGVIEDDDQVYF